MASTNYKTLRDDCSDSHDDDLLVEVEVQHKGFLSRKVSLVLVSLLTCSVFLNAIWVYGSLRTPNEAFGRAPSYYAGLVKDVPVPISINTVYTHENRKLQDAAWSAPELETETGLVALSESYVRSKGLLPAQRWPWDHSKGIYVINGFHSLHCIHALRKTLFQAYDGKPLSYPLEHTAHCLNVLRDDVMCNADDTPRYTGRLNAERGKEHPTSGVGQVRMCNDWNKLRAWANEHSGCYKPINQSNPDFPTIERYKFCPDGKVLWDQ